MKYAAIIPGAGSSIRFKNDKLISRINGEMIVKHAIEHFNNDDECEKIVLVVQEKKFDFYKKLFCLYKKILVIKTNSMYRAQSVYSGLQYCLKNEFVIIHDACRPYLNNELLQNLKLEMHANDAVAPCILIEDSIIEVKSYDDFEPIRIANREHYKRLQTPQGFKTLKLKEVFDQHKSDFVNYSDEFSLFVKTNKNHILKLIDGQRTNIKITYPEDLINNNYE